MFRTEIDRIYTQKISEYFAKGYSVYTKTMAGSQGEVAHIDLKKGDDVIRILMEKRNHGDDWFAYELAIIVGRWNEPLRGYDDETIWNNKLETIEEMAWIEVDRKGNYYCTAEEWTAIRNKRRERLSWSRYENHPKPFGNVKRLDRIRKSHKGFRGTKATAAIATYNGHDEKVGYRVNCDNGKYIYISLKK